MAVKRLPSGVNVNMGFDEESPINKLNNLITTVGAISSGVQQIQEKREVSDINAMKVLYETIDNYTTPADLDRLQRMKDNISSNKVYNNQAGNILNETLDFAISKKRSNYTDVRSQASQLATELMSSNNVLGTPLYELTEADLVRSFTDNIAKEKKEGGYLASVAERRMKAAGFNSLIENFVGKDGYGRMKTIPSMKIPYTRDDGSQGEMSLAELIKRQARHDEVLQGVVSGAAIDGVISPEQASVIVSLTGEEGFDIDAFIKTGENQRKMFTDELKFRRGSNKDAITKLSSILRTYKEGEFNEAAYVENTKDFANNEDVQSVNPVALTGDPEKDTEEFFKQLQSGNIDKGLFTVMLNDLIEKNDAGIKRAIRGLEAWDVKGIYGNIEPTGDDDDDFNKETIKKSTQDSQNIDFSDLNLSESFVVSDAKDQDKVEAKTDTAMTDAELLQAREPVKKVKKNTIMYKGREHEVDSNGRVKAGMVDNDSTYSWTGQLRRAEPKKYIKQTMDKEGVLTFNNLNDFLSNFDLTKSEFSKKERDLIDRIAKESDTEENRRLGKSLLRKYLISEKFPGSFRGEKGFPSGGKSSIFNAIKQLKKYYSVGENRKQDYSSYQALKGQIPILKELLGLNYDLTSNQKLASMMSKHSKAKTINELEQGILLATPFAKFGYADEK
tara:strand:- start:11320 stop:13335 length:2016 start_codon:yes stop_codon:yes gene_type:complete